MCDKYSVVSCASFKYGNCKSFPSSDVKYDTGDDVILENIISGFISLVFLCGFWASFVSYEE